MEDGWVKIFRRFLDWEWYSDGNMVRLFLHLLLRANYEDKRWRGMVVSRGQLITSLESLSNETHLSVRNIRTCLQRLLETGEIDKQTTSKFTIITICKYDSYQQIEDHKRQTNDKQATNERQTNDKQATNERQQHKKERSKELKKERNKYIDISDDISSSDDYSSDAAKSRTDYKKLISFFNRTMDEAKAVIPRCKSCDGKRKEYVNGRIREHGLDAVYEMITKAAASDFLNGGGSRGFVADFTWLFRPSNFQKVLEGNYDNRQNHGTRDYERKRRADDAADLVNKLLAEDGQP